MPGGAEDPKFELYAVPKPVHLHTAASGQYVTQEKMNDFHFKSEKTSVILIRPGVQASLNQMKYGISR